MELEFYDRELFLNENKAFSMMEYDKELKLLKQLIILVREYLEEKEHSSLLSYEGVCYLFADSIIGYAEMAYDNMVLGHIDAANMIIRAIIENMVCLNIIMEYEEKELWKYWLTQSMYKALIPEKKYNTLKKQEILKEFYDNFNIEKEFLKKHPDERDKRAYIERNYGWAYKVNNNKFSFNALCDLKKEYRYTDFGWASIYTHGTSIYTKLLKSVFEEQVYNMISCLVYNLNMLASNYMKEMIGFDYVEISEELKNIFEQSS